MPRGSLRTSLLFTGRFLRHPMQVASVWPSSATLGRAMAQGLELATGDAVIEYGPGTGSFTEAIDAVLRRTPDTRYLGIESDPVFCGVLTKRFPHLEFVCDRVERAPELAAQRGLPRPRAVISGLPIICMPEPVREQIFRQSLELLGPGGLFRSVSYVHSYPRVGARWLRRRMREACEDFSIAGPFVNLPPALVLSGYVGSRLRRRPSAPVSATDAELMA